MVKRFFLTETNVLAIISLNAVVIFLMYFPSLENVRALLLLDHFFLLLFCLEAAVKINALKWKNYIANRWNQFDFIIVLLSLPSLLENFVEVPNSTLLLVLRLFRLIRLIRFIRFVPHISMIMAGLARALKSSVFVLLALIFFNFLLSLVTCHFFRGIAPEYFGNPLISAYSIFQLFTLEGWAEIPRLISERSSNDYFVGFTRLYFVTIVLFGGIFGLSLANAIFVDEMTIDNNKILEDKIDELKAELAELKQLLSSTQNKERQ
jgi:voltage-gated sodium channel